MRISTNTLIVCFLGLLGAAMTAPRAWADEWNQKTLVTFKEPVEVPGVVLPAGQYVFKLLDSPSDRNIVEILNARESHVYATVLAVSDYRLRPPDSPVITFEERAAGSPEAIKAWFYPGEEYGHEFMYPRAETLQVAQTGNQPAPTASSNVNGKAASQSKSGGNAAAMSQTRPPVLTPENELKTHRAAPPNKEEVQIAQAAKPKNGAAQTAGTAPAKPAPAPKPKTLPRTASELPLMGLTGMLALGMAATVRRLSRQMA